MKKVSFSVCNSIVRVAFSVLALVLFFSTTNAQMLAEWPLVKSKTPAYAGLGAYNVATGVTAGTMGYDNVNTFSTTTPNAQGAKLKTINSNVWPSAPNPAATDPNFNLDFPISPAAGYDFTITGLTLSDTAPSSIAAGDTLAVAAYYQIDGAGPWIQFGNQQVFGGTGTVDMSFGTLYLPFFSKSANGKTHTYDVRLSFYTTTPATTTKDDYFYLARVIFYGTTNTPAATPPTVTTGTPTASGKYKAIGVGTYSFGASYQNPTMAGVTWSTTANPSIATAPYTTDGANGTINASNSSNITGLNAGTLYHVRAYAVTPLDTLYGQDLTFTTAAPSIPSLTTVAASNILSYKATSGGNITDSGGIAITQKGVCWSTTSGTESATVGSSFSNDGSGSATYSSNVEVLQPSTTYYVKAYAKNSLGIGYGNEISFTTATAVPYLSAIPSNLSFGTVVINGASTILSFKLTGSYLTPSLGTVTVTPPTGFAVSTSSNSGFVTTPITVPYNSGSLSTIIYVKLLTTTYGTNTGNILLSGGGAVNPNIDTVSVLGTVTIDPNVLTNSGTDFWAGYGYEERMTDPAKKQDYGLSLYIAAGSTASVVVVDLPLFSAAQKAAYHFPRTVNVPANTAVEVTGFPLGDTTDAKNANNTIDSRLYYTGVTNRGIHVYSTNGVPVSVFMNDWATNNSEGATMLFPSNTWNSSYVVQAYGGESNTGVPNSYFFVIANEDNTQVIFTPSNSIIDSASSPIITQAPGGTIKYAAGTSDTVTLNAGQIFNAMGYAAVGGNNKQGIGVDLSGTTVSTTCDKKIAVFGGNGRVLVTTNLPDPGCAAEANTITGSDNLIQQMFPDVAWGTKYLTAPTKMMEYAVYRINVQDPTTKVWVNNPTHTTPLTGIINNTYYQIENATPNVIESDKPICVTQFIIAGDCKNASNGNIAGGDPEMIILSPVQQPVTSSTVYAAPFKSTKTIPGGGASYINVIIPNSGVSSFQLDGQTTGIDTGSSSYNGPAFAAAPQLINNIANAFVKHPGDTSYSYGRFRVTTGASHSLSSNVGFNAIAYGINTGNSAGESWGYNAGTAIKNLTAIVSTITPYGSSPTAMTCKGNNTSIDISIPYPPSKVTSMQWISSADSSVTPTNDTISVNAPVSTGSFVSNGATYYTYQSPIQYKFDSVGTFKFTVVAYGPFTSQCGGSQTFNEVMTVVRDTTDFSFASVSCGSNQYNFTDITKSVSGDTLTKWQWTFYDNAFDSIGSSKAEDTSYTFPSKAIYQVKLRTINNIGCFSDTTKTVSLLGGTTALFIATPDTVCLGTAISFDGSASNSSYGTLSTYNWDFNDGTKTTTTTPTVSHTYATAGIFKATLSVLTATGCTSNVDTVPVFIASIPKPSFTFGGICLPDSTIFTNTSDTATGLIPYTYLWNFGEPSSLTNNTSTATNGAHAYTPPVPSNGYVVQLSATNRFGCVGDTSQTVKTVYAKPTAIIAPIASTCLGDSTSFTEASTAVNQTVTNWSWSFGDATNSTLQDPKHKYNSVDSFKVKLTIITDKGCTSDTTAYAVIKPVPVAGFILPSSCQGSGSVTFTDTSSITPDTLKPFTYNWSFGDPASGNNTSTVQNGQHTYASIGLYSVVEKVTATNGCSSSDTTPFDIAGSKPIPGFVVVTNPLCSNLPVQLNDTSRIALGSIIRTDIIWDEINNPAVVVTDNSPANGSAGSSKTYSNTYPDSTIDETYTIKLIAYSGSTCLDSSKQTIVVHGRPIVSFVASPSSICANASPVVFTGATETNGPAGTFTYSGTGVTNSSFNPAKATVGSNTIQAMFTTTNGCTDSANSTITVLPVDNVTFNLNSDTLHACLSDVITLKAISAATNFYWSESDSLVNNTITTSNTGKSISVVPKQDSTTYYVTTNASSCPASDSVKIYVSPYPTVSIVSPSGVNTNNIHDTTICYNGTATLTASTTDNATFIWSPDATLSSNSTATTAATPLDTTEYIVTATGSLYCVKTVYDTAIVNVLKPFNIGTRAGNDTSLDVAPGEPVTLHAFVVDTSFHTPLVYSWSPTTYLDVADTSSPVLTPNTTFGGSNDSLVYTVTATTAQGCEAKDTITVHFYNITDIYVPTAFTPNGDGHNDMLIPVPVGITHFEYFKVFNRYGNLVFSTTQIGNGWDGTINGSQGDVGTYIWETQGIDFHNKLVKRSGTVVLIR